MLEKIIEDVSGTKRLYFRESALSGPMLVLQLKKNNWENEFISDLCMQSHEDYVIFAYTAVISIYRPSETGIFICEKETGMAFLNKYHDTRKKYGDESKKREEKRKQNNGQFGEIF